MVPSESFVLSPDLCGAGTINGVRRSYMVRRCYIDIAREILSHLNKMEPAFQNVGVYGTPGVGKSIFASWLVSIIGASSPRSTIFYFSTAVCETVFFPDGTVKYMPADTCEATIRNLDFNGDELVWLIADGDEPPFGLRDPYKNLRVVVVSSANLRVNKWLHEWDKRRRVALLMPPFWLEEVLAAAKTQRVTQVGHCLRPLPLMSSVHA